MKYDLMLQKFCVISGYILVILGLLSLISKILIKFY